MFFTNQTSKAAPPAFTGIALLAIAFGFSLAFTPPLTPAQEPTNLQAATAVQRVLVDVIAQNEKSVVAIARVRKEDPAEAFNIELHPDAFGRRFAPLDNLRPTDPDFIPNQYATGVIIDPGGLILTAFHALGENSEYYVTTSDRKVYRAKVRAADPRSDLAVLAIEATSLPTIKFGDASRLQKGQIVIALGNPHAIARDGQVSAAWGIVANMARKSPPTDDYDLSGKTTLHHYGTLIQTDAKLNLGTSGGPLLDLSGRMVGLVTSLPPATGYEQPAGYAIPVDKTFRRVVDTLKQGREVEYGFLGIQPVNLTMRERADGLSGMRVERIQPGPGTPAYQSGLRPGDIITAVDGRPVHDADSLVLEVGRLPVESRVRLSIIRDGQQRPLTIKLGKYPVRGKKIVTNRPSPWRGIHIDYPTVLVDGGLNDGGLNNRVARTPGYFEDAVLVTEVKTPSPAWSAGLRPGMSITHVGSKAVHTPREFRSLVAGRPGPIELRLTEEEKPVRTIQPGS